MSTLSLRPIDGTVLVEVADSTPDEVEAAVRSAAAAAVGVSAQAPAVRRSWLYAVAGVLEQHLDELVGLAEAETALDVGRLTGEVARTAGQLRFYGDVAAEGSYLGVALDHATDRGPRCVRVNHPLGPVAVFGASNFPFAFSVLGNDTASALAAGCPVVAKAHPAHPQLSVRLAELARKALSDAGAPEGTLDLVSGYEAGAVLVAAPEVCAVAFTGSQAGGVALWRLANERDQPVPVYAEMGTVNPVVVTTGAAARMNQIATGFVESFTLGAGQYCTKPGLLLVPSGHGATHRVARALEQMSPTPVMLTEQIAKAVREGITELVAAGASVVGEVDVEGAGWVAPAAVMSASAASLAADNRMLEECFGAVALVVEYDGPEELHRVLGVLQGSLVATVVAGDNDPEAGALVRALAAKVGRVTVNDWPTGVAVNWAQQHGGPWPSTTVPWSTSVGANALDRFVRPVSYQSVPDAWVPAAGRADNPWQVPQRVNGVKR